MKKFLVLLAALVISACAGSLDMSDLTPEAQRELSYVVACKGYNAALSSIEPFRAQLSDVEVAILQGTMLRVGPICAAARAADFTNLDESLLRVLQGALRGAQGVLCHQSTQTCPNVSSASPGAASEGYGGIQPLLTASDCVARGKVPSLLWELHGEALYWSGWSNVELKGNSLDLFVNETTGSWTIVSYRGPMGCVEAIGKAHATVDPPTPGEDA